MEATEKTHYGFSDKYHSKRRTEIIGSHPELRDFMRRDPSFKYVAAATAATQIYISYCLRDASLIMTLCMSLAVGTLFDCAICNSLHETVHDLAIEGTALANKIFGNFLNLALAWPAIGGYYKSHRHHHAFLGTDLDAKYPSVKEAKKYDRDMWSRLKFVFLHPLAPGARWSAIEKEPNPYATWNLRSIIAFDLFVLVFWGYKSLLYLILSMWLNDCVLIQGSKNFADHWVDDNGQAYTSSNYGPVNTINFNIGYHREHHDFPNIPGRYLAAVYRRATEHYNDKRFIADQLFAPVWRMLTAAPGKGLIKHANKAPVVKKK